MTEKNGDDGKKRGRTVIIMGMTEKKGHFRALSPVIPA
jgi:hypothetical protein